MKATGVIRRIDELGRIVIPKEIRRTMRLREGDPLEIFTDVNGEIVFKKYSMIGEMGGVIKHYVEILEKLSPLPFVITDREHVIGVSNLQKKDILKRRISYQLDKILKERSTYIKENNDVKNIDVVEELDKFAEIIIPIIAEGDVLGAVVFLEGESGEKATEADIKLAQSVAEFLGKQTVI